jgi:hypothetical protein
MNKKKNPEVIEVSFKKDELELYYRIKRKCKFTTMAGWIKLIAFETLEQEEHPELYTTQPIQMNNYTPTQQNNELQYTPFKENAVNSLLDSFD